MKGFNPLSVADIAKTIGVYWKSEPGKDIKESHFRGDVELLGEQEPHRSSLLGFRTSGGETGAAEEGSDTKKFGGCGL
ncbi:hypothetical protein MTO96_039491 [Rhipicephalus appendiculatus]